MDNELKKKCLVKDKQKNKITPVQLQVLGYMVERQDEDVYQKDLESVLKLRRATVSGVLKTMEKNDLITRQTDSDDKRVNKIILSSKAKDAFESAYKTFNKIEKEVLEGIDDSDLEIFCRVLGKMQENIEERIIKNDALNQK